MEKRRYTRTGFQATCSFFYKGKTYHGKTNDLSLQGTMVELPQVPPVELKEEMGLMINLNKEGLGLHIRGVVVYISDDKVGIRFNEIDGESFIHLRRLLELNISQVWDVDREIKEIQKSREKKE